MTSDIEIHREPTTNVLYNKFVALRNTSKARSHGNYYPALQLLSETLELDEKNQHCPIVVLFLTDGKPSDICNIPLMEAKILELSIKFKKRLTFSAIGFSGPGADFAVLEKLASIANIHSTGIFSRSEACATVLSTIVSSVSTRLSCSRTRATVLDMGGKLRQTRLIETELLSHNLSTLSSTG